MTTAEIVVVRSPGKLFLLGEYAVLFGGPAIVQAVDRYVEVTVEAGTDSTPGISVVSLGASLAPLSGRFGHGLTFDSATPKHELVTTILTALANKGVLSETLGNVKCTVDSRALFEQGNKLGLGSSAAITHALTRAFLEYATHLHTDPSLQPEFTFNVHRAFQHGRGSGADVACRHSRWNVCLSQDR